ncbi:nucleotide exchange factor GrpE [Dictyobacter arantiisoli]|uniref:Protein GrpE n=1 Tax=Dictyobacter arantiisoli TaxID=2014874 RepID=A0A5A5TC53_9CHLR|nr:nucleotide exchange factor GrpE [Dictyobacter arantiisoli]GCF09012.1 protein GrpE [Dictyobacter arantiisoli]
MEDNRDKSAEQSENIEQQFFNTGDADQVQRIAELEGQLAQAKKEAADSWNKYVNVRADWDNFRKRQERMVTDRVLYQKKAVFNKLLEVLDNVERALIYEDTMDKTQLQHTLRMLQWQMNEVLRGEGLNAVPTVGETFNPYVHEAVEAVEDSDQPDGVILEELRKGYTLGEEILRPARVKVSVGNK